MPVSALVVSCNEIPWTCKNFSRYFRSVAPLGLTGQQAVWGGGLVTARCRLHFRADSLDLGRPSLGLGMSAQAGLYRCMLQKPKEAERISQYLALRLAVSCSDYLGLSGFGMSLRRISLFSLDVLYCFCMQGSLWVPGRTAGYKSLPKLVQKEAWQRPIIFLFPIKFAKLNLSNLVLALGEKNMCTLPHVFLFR